MSEQNYGTHRRRVPLMQMIVFWLLVLTLIGSIVNLVKSFGDHERLYSAALIPVLTVCAIVISFFARTNALKAQDRAIRAEENLRHFALTGKLLDPRLTVQQIIGLRFASDAELPELARRAADENMSMDAVKKAVKQWRADTYRI